MPHHHHPVFVGLSLLVAVLGSWTALDLFRRVRSHIGRTRLVWLGAAAVAMGVAIWSMHFIAMLGFDPGAPVSYDPALTVLSLLLAVGATWGAFFAAARERAGGALVMVAGAAMGAGICSMHYVGMAALRTAVSLGYEPGLVAASLLIAVAASTAALFAARRERARTWRAIAALILGFAIAGMHYTAMAALHLAPGPHMQSGAPPFVLATGVAAGALLILFMALLASVYDQRLNVMSALEAGGVGYWELTLPKGVLQVSARGKEIMGRDADAPFGLADLQAMVAPEDLARRALLEPPTDPAQEYDLEIRVPLPDGGVRWVNVRGGVVGASSAGRPRRLVGVIFDITERQEAFAQVADSERRQRLLIDELNHRVKNTLAAVQSISRQSAKRAVSVDDFRDLFEARLIALSQTHNALTRRAWEHAQLGELLHQQLGPYPPEQVKLSGPDLQLTPREALALGMVFHELATNAAKYGALSTPAGCVRVDWRVDRAPDAGPRLRLDWLEEGGPPVAKPARRGFGSRLVQGSIVGELGGAADLRFEPEGFIAQLSAPLEVEADDAPPALSA